MLCAISGEAPLVPVASRRSGNVFEKRLIESYIAENHKDPVTGEDLSVDDLVELKTARVVKPRPPTLTSIPSLLSVFQNEWDALALETYTLKQHLAQLRQELSTSLYNNDAAVRVIARLTKERDEARTALSRMSYEDRRTTSTTANGEAEAMQVDGSGMSDDLKTKLETARERLSKGRRKRPIPAGWATEDSLQALEFAAPTNPLQTAGKALALDGSSTTAIIGGADGSSCTYSIAEQETMQIVQGDGSAVTDVASWDREGRSLPVIATLAGEVAIFDNGEKVASFSSHHGSISGIALHPGGEVLGSVGVDKSFVFYDLSTSRVVTQIYTDSELTCCEFHPDGHLFAAGSKSGQIKIFETVSMQNAASFDAGGPVQSISFSENGVWLASVVKGSSSATVWDLRKGNELVALDFGSRIDSLKWDYTGQYLAAAGPGCVAVQAYNKATKGWAEPLRKASSAVAVAWGPQASSLIVLKTDGQLTILQ